MIQGEERKYKKGQIILKEKSFELAIYDVMLGRVGVYMNYGTPEERLVVEICAQQGANVNKGDVIAYIQRSDIFA